MEVLVTHSDRKELTEELVREGVHFQVSGGTSTREWGTGSYEVDKITANLPEVTVPARYRESSGDIRAFRLPSGRLILIDLEGNLDRIVTPPPGS